MSVWVIGVVVAYLGIGFCRAMSILSKAPSSQPLLATRSPSRFALLMLVVWPIPFATELKYDRRRRQRLPPSVRHLGHNNILGFLRQKELSALNPKELEWCQWCLYRFMDHNPISTDEFYGDLLEGKPLPNTESQDTALRFLKLIEVELSSKRPKSGLDSVRHRQSGDIST
jgi:hypothetical protein